MKRKENISGSCSVKYQSLNREWIQLIKSAKKYGFTKEEVREFLTHNSKD